MNKSIFSLADVLLVLTALAFGFVCFLGANFYTIGDTQESLIFAVIITVILAGLAYLAKRLKVVQRNFKTNFIAEIVALVFFTVILAFFTYSPFSHYFTVVDRKGKIQEQLSDNITLAQNMFDKYESYANKRMNNYHSELESVVGAKEIDETTYEANGFVKNGVSDKIQIDNKMQKIYSDLFPTNYSDTISNNGVKQVAKNWLADGKQKTKGWKPIGIVRVVNDIEEKSTSWRDDLVNNSTFSENGDVGAEFNYNLPFRDLKSEFTTLGKPTPLSIGLAILAWALMLLSWFITKRSSKVFGRLAPYEVEL